MRTRGRGIRGFASALACATALVGCVAGTGVQRVYDGDVVLGRFVSAEAYAAFLRGAIADADGHLEEAIQAYEEAAARQPASTEVWTRLGDLRCRQAPRDPRAEGALSRALSLDDGYAPAWAARASCALARGDVEAARTAARRAADLDPTADGAHALLARTAGVGRGALDPAMRGRLLALTATARNAVVAWDALATWAEAAGDVPLWAQARRELASRAPSRRREIARAAETLAGLGELGAARSVAAAAVDASPDPLPGGSPLAARLAVDEAILRHDGDAVRERVTRVRLSLEEAAGRALLAGDRVLARELALEVSRADRSARGPRLVLAACGGGDLGALVHDVASGGSGGPPVTSAAFVAFGLALASGTSAGRAREALRPLAGSVETMVDGDDRVERPAVELVSRGVLDRAVLPADALVELAVVLGDTPVPPDGPTLDPRHRYLALALGSPADPRTLELGKRLQGSTGDPVVAAAAALVSLASGAPITPEAPAALLARNAADPLLASIALRLAERVGDHDVAGRARRTLTALGGAAPAKE
jgi:Tfp pilus assembly protein PilF